MSNWNKVFKPIVVLGIICIVITGALAVTNQATAPIIAEAARVAAEKARAELLPDADGYTEIDPAPYEGVSGIYVADNGVGTIISSSAKGYSSTIEVMVAFNADGTIKQVKIQSQAETAGVGTKVTNESFWGQYSGLPASTITLDQEVDRISGASISSRAVNTAVNYAIDAYNAIP
ncbi:FMN-binding protein [Flavonifractor sp. An100]|uniref:FMN-binding protein n=1 Tax=Flavonifractor sp. An100 TaxID=1965538 RepID=UPI000B3A76CC|nr:FMN-binding protein [Flavonifractor sp. An100]OUQ80654.1 hypothetical protein B5E43_03920 [Flavonifractor sp. An100]